MPDGSARRGAIPLFCPQSGRRIDPHGPIYRRSGRNRGYQPDQHEQVFFPNRDRIAEQEALGVSASTGEFTLPNIIVLTARNGQIVRLRDYVNIMAAAAAIGHDI